MLCASLTQPGNKAGQGTEISQQRFWFSLAPHDPPAPLCLAAPVPSTDHTQSKPSQLFSHPSSKHTVNMALFPGQLGKKKKSHLFTQSTCTCTLTRSSQTWQSKQDFNLKQVSNISVFFPFLFSPWDVSSLAIWFGTFWFGCCKADKKTNQILYKIPTNDGSRPRLKETDCFFLIWWPDSP